MAPPQTVLFLVNGPWQATAGLSCLEQAGLRASHVRIATVLVDIDPSSPLFEVTSQILEAHQLQARICIPEGSGPFALSKARRAIEHELDVPLDQVALVVAYGYHRPVARYFCNHAVNARILFYEEGLRTHVEPEPMFAATQPRSIRDLWSLVDPAWTKTRVDPGFSQRDIEYALLLSDRIPLPQSLAQRTVWRVRAESVRQVLARATPAAHARSKPDSEPRRAALIVGQYYAQLKQMDAKTELAIYERAANTLAARGLVPVWRPHFRKDDRMYARLKERCSALRNFADYVDDPSYPLEFYVDFFTTQCACVVSLTSSALFYLEYLYGTPAYTLIDAGLVERMRYPHRDAALLALQHVKSLYAPDVALGRLPAAS